PRAGRGRRRAASVGTRVLRLRGARAPITASEAGTAGDRASRGADRGRAGADAGRSDGPPLDRADAWGAPRTNGAVLAPHARQNPGHWARRGMDGGGGRVKAAPRTVATGQLVVPRTVRRRRDRRRA